MYYHAKKYWLKILIQINRVLTGSNELIKLINFLIYHVYVLEI